MRLRSWARPASSQNIAAAPVVRARSTASLTQSPDRQIPRLAHAPDVPGLDLVLEQCTAVGIGHAHGPACGQSERLVVRAVLLGLLRHEADVADVAHRRHVERAVPLAVRDDLRVDARITAVGNHRPGVIEPAVRSPHLSGSADRRRHRCVDDHVARHVQVGDAAVGIDHREPRARRIDRVDIRLDPGAHAVGQRRDLRVHVADAVVGIDAELLEHGSMLFEYVGVVHPHGMPENDGIGDLHHRGLDVQRKENILFARGRGFRLEELPERLATHHGSVDDLAFEHLDGLSEHPCRTVGFDEFDPQAAGPVHHARLLAREEIALAHVHDVGLRLRTPGAHRVRVCLRVRLDGRGDAAVGVAFAQHRVDGAAEDLRVAGADFRFGVVARLLRVVRDRVALALKFRDRGRELRYGRADVRQLDDVGCGRRDEVAEFGEVVSLPLSGRQAVRKRGENPPGERDVPRLDRDAGRPRERFDDRQEGVRRKQRRLVGQRVYDPGLAHVFPYAARSLSSARAGAIPLTVSQIPETHAQCSMVKRGLARSAR